MLYRYFGGCDFFLRLYYFHGFSHPLGINNNPDCMGALVVYFSVRPVCCDNFQNWLPY